MGRYTPAPVPGPTGPAPDPGPIPSGYAEVASPVAISSATWADVAGASITITIPSGEAKLYAHASVAWEGAAGGTQSLEVRLVVGGQTGNATLVDEKGLHESLDACLLTSASLPAGDYVAKLQARSVNADALNITRVDLIAMAMQGNGAQGPAGPTGATGATGTNGTNGAAGATGAPGPSGPAGADGVGYTLAATATGIVTTDATPTTLLTITPPSAAVTLYEIFVVGNQSGGAAGIGYRRTLTVRRAGGGPTVITAGFGGGETMEDAGISGATVGVTTSGNNVIVQATGVAATMLTWSGDAFQRKSV